MIFLFRLYFTKVKLGSPPKEFKVQIDTGSDILWVACNACSDCPQSSDLGVRFLYRLLFVVVVTWEVKRHLEHNVFLLLIMFCNLQIELNFFDSASSSTASLISCSDPICTSATAVQSAATECSPQISQCRYRFLYGDGSGTSGYYVTDLMYFDMILGQSMLANSSATVAFG